MYKNILIPADGTELSEKAIQTLGLQWLATTMPASWVSPIVIQEVTISKRIWIQNYVGLGEQD
jgi:hypothetical protein